MYQTHLSRKILSLLVQTIVSQDYLGLKPRRRTGSRAFVNVNVNLSLRLRAYHNSKTHLGKALYSLTYRGEQWWANGVRLCSGLEAIHSALTIAICHANQGTVGRHE